MRLKVSFDGALTTFQVYGALEILSEYLAKIGSGPFEIEYLHLAAGINSPTVSGGTRTYDESGREVRIGAYGTIAG